MLLETLTDYKANLKNSQILLLTECMLAAKYFVQLNRRVRLAGCSATERLLHRAARLMEDKGGQRECECLFGAFRREWLICVGPGSIPRCLGETP